MLTALLGIFCLTVVALLSIIAVKLEEVVLELKRIKVQLKGNTRAINDLRLKSRTRIAQASARTGEVSDEVELRRLGRASAARRVVVGGDDDSDLNRALQRQADRGREVSNNE